MKAFLATSPQTLELVEQPMPEPAANEVLVRTRAVGICGSDIHLFRGDHPYTTYPMIFGHEASGIIEAIGSEVQGFAAGEHVVLEPLIPCGKCYPCSIGRQELLLEHENRGGDNQWRVGGIFCGARLLHP